MGMWHVDHTRLDIAVDGQEVEQPCRPWLTVVMDSNTRRLVDCKLSTRPLTDVEMAQFLDETLEDEALEDETTKTDDDKEDN